MYELASRSNLHARAKKQSRNRFFQFFVSVVLLIIWWVTLAPSTIGGPITYAVVSGQSMEPQYVEGDLVIAKAQAEYEIHDAIVYQIYGGYVVHDVISKQDKFYRTQGVNNPLPDSWLIPEENILGKELISVPGLGNTLVFLRTNPLILSFCVTALAALLLIEFHPQALSRRLKNLIEQAKREPPVKKWRAGVWLSGVLFILTAASLVATSVLLTSGVDFFPRVAITLAAAVLAAIAFEVVGLWTNGGESLPEPYRSIRSFSQRLYILDSKIDIPGPSEMVRSSKELRRLAEAANSPVVHRIRKDGHLHEFWLITDDLNYFWRVTV